MNKIATACQTRSKRTRTMRLWLSLNRKLKNSRLTSEQHPLRETCSANHGIYGGKHESRSGKYNPRSHARKMGES